MSEMRDKMEDFIKSYYEERHSEVVITKRIASRLYDALYNENLEWNSLPDSEQRARCGELLNRDYIYDYVVNRQPLISKASNGVIEDVKQYFAARLPDYNVIEVNRRSNYREDSYLYTVIAQNTNGSFACWSSWNDSIKSLNCGHYGLDDMDKAVEILKQNYHDITDELDKYGWEQSGVSVADCQPVEVQQEQERRLLQAAEEQLLYGSTDKYGIYQLKKTPELDGLRFEGTESLKRMGITKYNFDAIKPGNYELVYTGELKDFEGQTSGETLEAIYTKFNIDHPEDFKGHSLSVSDVVVLHQDGANTANFVDSFGFTELPDFMRELENVVQQEQIETEAVQRRHRGR